MRDLLFEPPHSQFSRILQTSPYITFYNKNLVATGTLKAGSHVSMSYGQKMRGSTRRRYSGVKWLPVSCNANLRTIVKDRRMSGISLETARRVCLSLLETKDRSSFILSKYIPANSHDGFVGLRALNLETAKVVDSARDRKTADLRLQFWKSSVQQIHAKNAATDQPVVKLLQHSISQGSRIPKRYPLTLIQTREAQLAQKPIRTVDDMARFGEGVYSQLLYATLDMLQAWEAGTTEFLEENTDLDELVSNLCAHIGQASGIAAYLRALPFYAAKHNFVVLPSNLLSKANISQQQIIDLITQERQRPVAGLNDVVFEVATAANDHMLTARSLLNQFKEITGGTVPQSLVLTAMSAVPVSLYLEMLEKYDFDILRTSHIAEWKLPWRSWRAFQTRSI